MLNQIVQKRRFFKISPSSTGPLIISNRISFSLQIQPSRYFARTTSWAQPGLNLRTSRTSRVPASQTPLDNEPHITWKAQNPQVSSRPDQINDNVNDNGVSERVASSQAHLEDEPYNTWKAHYNPEVSSRPEQINDIGSSERDASTQSAPDLQIPGAQQSSDSVHSKYLGTAKRRRRRGQGETTRTKRSSRPTVARGKSYVRRTLLRNVYVGETCSQRQTATPDYTPIIRNIYSRPQAAKSDPARYLAWDDETLHPTSPLDGLSIPILHRTGEPMSFFNVGIIRPFTEQRIKTRTKTIFLRPFNGTTSPDPTAKQIVVDEADREHTSRLDEWSWTWTLRYAVIADRKRSLDLWRGPGMKREFLNLIGVHMSRTDIANKWQRLEPKWQNKVWERYMLLALQLSPERALKVLDVAVSLSIPKIPSYVLWDCLDFLAGKYLEDVKTPDCLKFEKIYQLLCVLAKVSCSFDGQGKVIPQKTVYWVLRYCNNGQAESLYQEFCNELDLFHPMTLLHFLAKFVDMEKIPLALDVLRKISCTKMDLDSKPVQSGCVKLIRTRILSRHGTISATNLYRTQMYILAEILRMGVRPAIPMYNAMILNAVEAREYRSALGFYKSAIENGLKPDEITYGTLLKGAMQNLDWGIFHTVVQDAEADGTLYREDRVIFDVLWVALKLETSASMGFLFNKLLQIYEKYCDPAVLRDLGLCKVDATTAATSERSARPPSSRIVGLMLMVYIRQHRFSDGLFDIYDRYRHYVEQNRPEVVGMAETDHVLNAFVWAFAQRPETLQSSTKLVKDMLDMSADSHAAAASQQGYSAAQEAIKYASPTVQTWSILLSGYLSFKQTKGAEKILAMMYDRGMEPNQVTWNTMVRGYSSMQDIHTAIDVIKRMESKGFKMDRFTLKGLGRYKNRTHLLQILKDTFGDELETETQGQDQDPDQDTDAEMKAEAEADLEN